MERAGFCFLFSRLDDISYGGKISVSGRTDSLCTKISPIFYIANANHNPAGPSTPQYGSYPHTVVAGVQTTLGDQILKKIWQCFSGDSIFKHFSA